jgi:hypothetical protein
LIKPENFVCNICNQIFRYSFGLQQHSLKHVVPNTVAASDQAVGAVQDSDDDEDGSDEYDSADEEIRQFYSRELRRREAEFGTPDERDEDVAMEPTTFASPGQQFVAGENVEVESHFDGTPPPKRRKTTTEEEAASNSIVIRKCQTLRILLKKIPAKNVNFDDLIESDETELRNPPPHGCPHCPFSGPSTRCLRWHIAVVHCKRYLVRYYELDPNTCEICRKRFDSQKAFLKHFAYAHRDVLPSKCALPKRDARTKCNGKYYNTCTVKINSFS